MNAPITVGAEEVLTPDGWVIDDEERAAWAVSVIRARRRHLADLEEQHAVRMAKAERELGHSEAVLIPQLEAWARAETKKAKNGARHVDVATGRLQFRARPASFKVTDDAKALAFARTLPDAIRRVVEERIDAERLKHGAAVLFTRTMAETIDTICKTRPNVSGNDAVTIAQVAAAAALAAAGIAPIAAHDTFTVGSGSDR